MVVPIEHGALGGAVRAPTPRKDRRRRAHGRRRLAALGIGAVDRREDLAERDARRVARKAIAARRSPRAGDEPRTLQLKQDLHEVAFGNRVRTRKSRGCGSGERSCAPLRQSQHRQTRIFGFRGNFHWRNSSVAVGRRMSRRRRAARKTDERGGLRNGPSSELTAIQRVQAAFRLGKARPAARAARLPRPRPGACTASSRSTDIPGRGAGCTEPRA